MPSGYPGACTPFLPLIAGATSAYFAGVHSGKLGVALKAGVIAGATALAFQAVGIATAHNPGFDDPEFLPNVFGHALVGCGSSVASGGKCGPGALSAGVTAFAGPVINGKSFSIGSLIMNTTIGGLASVAGGGKFANGAVTGAFGYLANNLGGSATDPAGATGGETSGTRSADDEATWPSLWPCRLVSLLGTSCFEGLAGGGRGGGAGGRSGAGGGGGGTTALYRAVSPAELESIKTLNAFSNLPGLEVKYFSTTLQGAQSYAAQASKAFGGDYLIVETSIPTRLITNQMRATVDRGITTVTVPTELLPRLAPPRTVGP